MEYTALSEAGWVHQVDWIPPGIGIRIDARRQPQRVRLAGSVRFAS
jgi:hypothetical protein